MTAFGFHRNNFARFADKNGQFFEAMTTSYNESVFICFGEIITQFLINQTYCQVTNVFYPSIE